MPSVYRAWIEDEPIMDAHPVFTDGVSVYVVSGEVSGNCCVATRLSFDNKSDEYIVNVYKFNNMRIKTAQTQIFKILREPEVITAIKHYVDVPGLVSDAGMLVRKHESVR